MSLFREILDPARREARDREKYEFLFFQNELANVRQENMLLRDKLERAKDKLRNVESKLSEYRMRCKILEMSNRSQKHSKLSESDEESSEASYVLLTPRHKRRKVREGPKDKEIVEIDEIERE